MSLPMKLIGKAFLFLGLITFSAPVLEASDLIKCKFTTEFQALSTRTAPEITSTSKNSLLKSAVISINQIKDKTEIVGGVILLSSNPLEKSTGKSRLFTFGQFDVGQNGQIKHLNLSKSEYRWSDRDYDAPESLTSRIGSASLRMTFHSKQSGYVLNEVGEPISALEVYISQADRALDHYLPCAE
jgi:hypothetical protein